ncbi:MULTISPECIES: CDF family Co(II)/Ni(II) efflux transporter DmeF [Bradyrhizobium]|jgi:cation diffusion facilitator family transporter|uniref:CDF family Co(II)/Ni(II) efflux transporter DmeF n=2 Tax=Bradyrhizobium TaxID=374 RepID=A0ABS5GJP9_9BRAD|nr:MULTISPECIES: CDF family Co(II)/Ni(II) efflux transporter DmeF [Bradyrhizobium]MBR1141559.1 CDF family Co(II)/Ni(II) efflux transporter DmeF [Bradyrhizobium denitrificans]MDU1498036.1 CDF family Co(II)/Ni(II) efflux transporter DmeF [Bradyrhizobium sp.]MDU1548299.1 CDF family Co(II)/Ni(II) efflux transporter DmeF [Bradyrhizobium sp.]MDU1671372.1 CDF family Co(II)/Ni(II) efflux transporter DmeF [Bradyrhizobium sp.]MDU1695337.1 CDF family Co(II)/Ni(II) efflux transporter DmeF [Bradyrhizobium 
MSETSSAALPALHSHVFLSEDHQKSERKTWAVIWLCAAMMVVEIVGGWLFGSIALIADGLHMSTHAGALLLAALAYTYARKYADDPRFTFGTGKLGDLAGFTSAIILAMIALLIGYEAISRLFEPVPIHFTEAIPIAILGLAVNVASAWLLSGGHGHGHGHSHGHDHADHEEDDETHRIATDAGAVILEVFEDGMPPRFRLRSENSGIKLSAAAASVETVRPDGAQQVFTLEDRGSYLESVEEIPEPHAFEANVRIGAQTYPLSFQEHEHAHGSAARDHNMRAALVHVMADAAVSVLVIVGLLLARAFGWHWMDPLAGIIGACVIASWSFGLIRDTGAILLDMNPDRRMADNLKRSIEDDGDQLVDLHLWRLGPGHLGAIVSVATAKQQEEQYYRAKLARFRSLSHLTIEVKHINRTFTAVVA